MFMLYLVKEYWKLIVLSTLCCTFFFLGYKIGFNTADVRWIEANNSTIQAMNAKIERIEHKAASDVAQAIDEKALIQRRLDTLVADVPPVMVHDSKGRTVKCEGHPVQAFMGTEFSSTWNKINEESGK